MKNIFIFISIIVIIFALPTSIQAQVNSTQCPADSICIDSPINVNSPQELVGKVISGILSVVGSLALAMFVYGGIVWMTASGSPEKVTKGKNIIVWAAIGLAVVFSAYALVAFVFKGLGIEK